MKESFADLVARQEAAKRAEEARKTRLSPKEIERRAALSSPEGHPLGFLLDDREALLATEFLKYMKQRSSRTLERLSLTGKIETPGLVDRILGRTALRSGVVFSTYGYKIGLATHRPGDLKTSDHVPMYSSTYDIDSGIEFIHHKNIQGHVSLYYSNESIRDENVLPVYLCTDERLRTKNAATLPADFRHFMSGGWVIEGDYDREGQYARRTGQSVSLMRIPLEDVLLVHATS